MKSHRVCYSEVKRMGEKTRQREERKRIEQKYRKGYLTGSWSNPTADLPRYLRLRNGCRTNIVVAAILRYLLLRLSRFLSQDCGYSTWRPPSTSEPRTRSPITHRTWVSDKLKSSETLRSRNLDLFPRESSNRLRDITGSVDRDYTNGNEVPLGLG